MTGNGIILEHSAVVIDVNDLAQAAAFWGGLLGQEPGAPRSGGGWLTVGILEGDIGVVAGFYSGQCSKGAIIQFHDHTIEKLHRGGYFKQL